LGARSSGSGAQQPDVEAPGPPYTLYPFGPASSSRSPLGVRGSPLPRSHRAEEGGRWECAARMAFETGMRVGEISHLTWRSVDLASGVVTVQPEKEGWEPKDHEAWSLCVSTHVGEALAEMCAQAVEEILEFASSYIEQAKLSTEESNAFAEAEVASRRVFGAPNPDGFEKELREKLKEACERAGVPQIRPHGLRKTLATILPRKGLPPFDLRTVLGHSSIETTAEYYVAEDRRRAAQRALSVLHSEKVRDKTATTFSGETVRCRQK